LLVHKSTHHFDLVNWLIDAVPEEVFAFGDLKFYGKKNALARGEIERTKYDRYTGVAEAENDPFKLTLEEGSAKELYLNAEADSGYIRDRNVFRDDIDIEDTMGLVVRYRTGAILTYSLVAYSPIEGFRVTFTGDKGRLEYTEMHSSHIIKGQTDEELAEEQEAEGGHKISLRLYPMFGQGHDVPIALSKGGHGGADPLLQEQIFSPNPPEEKLARNAGHEQGAASILIGIAANQSIKSGEPVVINDLCSLRPDAKKLSELI
jgi:predicted dehydrogenase